MRKGEKGIAILAPIVRRRREETPEDESPVVVGFRTAYVFDVDQTDGAPLPQAAEVTGDPGEHTAALKRAIAARGISVEYADDLGGALGLSRGERIRVLNGLSAASEFAVLAHEFGHELLHHSGDRPESRDTRELEAEAVAFVVGQAVGLEAAEAVFARSWEVWARAIRAERDSSCWTRRLTNVPAPNGERRRDPRQ